MSLCASGKLTNSNKKRCEEFNSYLKAKQEVKKRFRKSKSAAASNANIRQCSKKLNSLNSDISSKEAEIQYVETSIQNTQADIDKDNNRNKRSCISCNLNE